MKRVTVAPEADQDLVDISSYIGEDNAIRAVTFVREIFDKFRVIAEPPQSFAVRDDVTSGLRAANLGSYIIFFVDYDTHVRIVRVMHGARNIPELF